jgi:hypothetical protein
LKSVFQRNFFTEVCVKFLFFQIRFHKYRYCNAIQGIKPESYLI